MSVQGSEVWTFEGLGSGLTFCLNLMSGMSEMNPSGLQGISRVLWDVWSFGMKSAFIGLLYRRCWVRLVVWQLWIEVLSV